MSQAIGGGEQSGSFRLAGKRRDWDEPHVDHSIGLNLKSQEDMSRNQHLAFKNAAKPCKELERRLHRYQGLSLTKLHPSGS